MFTIIRKIRGEKALLVGGVCLILAAVLGLMMFLNVGPFAATTQSPSAMAQPTKAVLTKPVPVVQATVVRNTAIPTPARGGTPVVIRNEPEAPNVIVIDAPIGGGDVAQYGPLHFSVGILFVLLVLVLNMETKERNQIGDFYSSFLGGMLNLATTIPTVSALLTSRWEFVLTGVAWGAVAHAVAAGGVDFTSSASYLVIIAVMGFLRNDPGAIGRIFSISSSKIYTFRQAMTLLQNKMGEEATLSLIILGLLAAGSILLMVELLRSRAPRAFVVGGLSIATYLGTKQLLASSGANMLFSNTMWIVPILTAVAVAFLAAFIIVRVPAIERLLPSGVGGNPSQPGLRRQEHLGLTFDSILFVLSLGITIFIAIG